MASVNKVIIVGHLGRDPECRSFSNGTRVCNLNVATSENWRDRMTGERKEATEWHRVTVWPENTVEFCDKYLRKGDRVYIEGKLETRKWQDQSGQDRYSTEINVRAFFGQVVSLAEHRGDGGGDNYGNGGGRTGQLRDRAQAQPPAQHRTQRDELDDDIPF